jgi:hypothetical protein
MKTKPPHKPSAEDRKQVELLAGLGIPQDQISLLIQGGIDDKTLRKYYAAELVLGVAKANSQVSKSLFQKATAGDISAQIWWTKTRMGWKDTSRIEHTGKDGGAIIVQAANGDESL